MSRLAGYGQLGFTLATKLTDVINETMNDSMDGVLHHEEAIARGRRAFSPASVGKIRNNALLLLSLFCNVFADSGVLSLPAFFIHIRYKIRIEINNSYELNNALEYAAYTASEGQNEKKKQNRKRFCTRDNRLTRKSDGGGFCQHILRGVRFGFRAFGRIDGLLRGA